MIIRAYDGRHIGSTGFFRNRALHQTVHDCIDRLCPPAPRVLFHAASIGAEPYSYVIGRALRHPDRVEGCDATDIAPDFLKAATRALPRQHSRRHDRRGRGVLRACRRGQRCHLRTPSAPRARAAAPASYAEFEAEASYDVVFLLNSLLYVDAAAQRRAIARIASYNTRLLITTGFHPDTIQADLTDHGYRPITTNQVEIHEGWTERRSLKPGITEPGVTFCSPYLPPFSPLLDADYRFGAIFERAA